MYRELLLASPMQSNDEQPEDEPDVEVLKSSDNLLKLENDRLEAKVHRLEKEIELKKNDLREALLKSTDSQTLEGQFETRIADANKKTHEAHERIKELEAEIQDYQIMEDNFAKLKQKEVLISEKLKREIEIENKQRNTINELKETLKRFQKENSLIREKHERLQQSYSELKRKYLASKSSDKPVKPKDRPIEEQDFVLEEDRPTGLSLDIQENIEQQEERANLKKEIQEYLKHDAALSDEELARLTGDLFEIDSGPHWYYKDGKEEHGPYTFEEMLQMHEENQIDGKTMIRGNSGNWKALDHTYEFSTPYQFSVRQLDGKIIKTYYLKRTSVRAPFYDIASLQLDGQEIRGYCTSLSSGGCFIELGRQEMAKIALGSVIKIEIQSQVLKGTIQLDAKIVNSSSNRPRGIGLSFVEPSEESLSIINAYVQHFLDNQTTVKKAA